MSTNTPQGRRTAEATLISRWFLKSYELTEGSQRHYTGNRKVHGYVALPSGSHSGSFDLFMDDLTFFFFYLAFTTVASLSLLISDGT